MAATESSAPVTESTAPVPRSSLVVPTTEGRESSKFPQQFVRLSSVSSASPTDVARSPTITESPLPTSPLGSPTGLRDGATGAENKKSSTKYQLTAQVSRGTDPESSSSPKSIASTTDTSSSSPQHRHPTHRPPSYPGPPSSPHPENVQHPTGVLFNRFAELRNRVSRNSYDDEDLRNSTPRRTSTSSGGGGSRASTAFLPSGSGSHLSRHPHHHKLPPKQPDSVPLTAEALREFAMEEERQQQHARGSSLNGRSTRGLHRSLSHQSSLSDNSNASPAGVDDSSTGISAAAEEALLAKRIDVRWASGKLNLSFKCDEATRLPMISVIDTQKASSCPELSHSLRVGDILAAVNRISTGTLGYNRSLTILSTSPLPILLTFGRPILQSAPSSFSPGKVAAIGKDSDSKAESEASRTHPPKTAPLPVPESAASGKDASASLDTIAESTDEPKAVREESGGTSLPPSGSEAALSSPEKESQGGGLKHSLSTSSLVDHSPPSTLSALVLSSSSPLRPKYYHIIWNDSNTSKLGLTFGVGPGGLPVIRKIIEQISHPGKEFAASGDILVSINNIDTSTIPFEACMNLIKEGAGKGSLVFIFQNCTLGVF